MFDDNFQRIGDVSLAVWIAMGMALGTGLGSALGVVLDNLALTALVDCDSTAILDVHWSMKQPHDTQVGRQVLTRNPEKLKAITTKATTGTRCVTNSGRLASVR